MKKKYLNLLKEALSLYTGVKMREQERIVTPTLQGTDISPLEPVPAQPNTKKTRKTFPWAKRFTFCFFISNIF